MTKVVVTALAVLLLATALSAQTIQLDDGAFRVTGWKPEGSVTADDLPAIFAVYSGGADAPPVLGTYSVEGTEYVFRPNFPLAAGVQYRAVFQPAGKPTITVLFDGPKRETNPVARVERIYPSTDVLPANELRLYIFFSAPMSVGEWKNHIRVLDEAGKPLNAPFLEIGQELWDPTYTRLTVYFDPGRIKRGLVPNRELGPPVAEGKRYTIVIDRDFHDARGVPMVEGFTKTIRGGPAVRMPIDPKKWRISEPKAGTREPLTIDFPQAMDYALLERVLRIPGISGSIAIDRGETRWTFTPAAPWKSGSHHIDVDFALEDLAGNRIDHMFDIDTSENPAEPPQSGNPPVPFRVK